MSSVLPAPPPPPLPIRLFAIILVIAIIVTVAIAYLGISGKLGLGIPGQKSPPSHSTTAWPGAASPRAGAAASLPPSPAWAGEGPRAR